MSDFCNTSEISFAIIKAEPQFSGESERSFGMNTFEKARAFVYRNARPLDLALWRYHFESGSREDVLRALSFYQNEDGGFGHGLEPDNLNPNSIPLGAWAATEILVEIGFTDRNHPIVAGLLRYLDSGSGFDEKQRRWLYTLPSNNDYPHAIWWEHQDGAPVGYNPTAALAGFALCVADEKSALYENARSIAEEAARWFISAAPYDDMHDMPCFIALYNEMMISGFQPVDMDIFKSKLRECVKLSICTDTQKWAAEYVATPSTVMMTRESMFYEDNAQLAEYECDFIKNTQLADGGFNITWQWCTDYKEYEVAANVWRAKFALKNMLYLRNFGAL